MKKYGTLVGIALGCAAIFGSFVLEGGSLGALLLLPPMTVVFGGTFATAIVGNGWKRFINGWKLFKIAMYPKEYDGNDLVELLVQYTARARKDGLLSLDNDAENVQYPFLKKLLRLAIDGTDSESIRTIAEGEIARVSERHAMNAALFSKMGGYSPTMGIIGTVMGLIMAMANAGEDPKQLIHNMASAFIATLWGIFNANIIWLPIADRLKICHLEEKQYMEIALEGVLAVQQGEVSAIIRARLMGMLPGQNQE